MRMQIVAPNEVRIRCAQHNHSLQSKKCTSALQMWYKEEERMDGYGVVKGILSIVALAAFLSEVVFLVKWLIMLIKRNRDKKRSRYAAIALVSFFVFGLCLVAFFAISLKQYTNEFSIDKLPSFQVQSDSLKDGVWDRTIGFKVDNKSPELHWDKVSGATVYAILMIDPDGNNWLHWLSYTEKTSVELGEFSGADKGFVGPYPPSGTHNYDVYVFALKGNSFGVSAALDKAGASVSDIALDLNSGEMSEFGNIISCGKISGSFSAD